MSSPFSPRTKRGTEETLEALSRTREWASRIDTKNDATNVSTDFVEELREEEERLREKYRIKTTEVAIDNFVFNQEDTVIQILCGNLDEKVSALGELDSYIDDEFGSERPIDLSKEELVWLVAQEVKYHQGRQHGIDEYDDEPLASMDLSSEGEQPSHWGDEFPIYNRDS